MSAALFALVKARAKYSMTLTAHQQLKCSMTLTARQQLKYSMTLTACQQLKCSMQLSLLLLTSSLQLAAVILHISAVILQHNMFSSICCSNG